MFRYTNLLFSLLVLALIFSFSIYNPFSQDSGIYKMVELGPEFVYAGDDDDDDDDGENDNDEPDDDPFILYSFFDLRDRETYVQVTNIGPSSQLIHVQVFNVDNDCNENNFFDLLTPADTHVYNLRDIQTNDGSPSGFVLPANAYGAVIISTVTSAGGVIEDDNPIVGNVRMLDDLGYEYRTNIPGKVPAGGNPFLPLGGPKVFTFNFNTEAGVILSDVFGITTSGDFAGSSEITMADPTSANILFDIDLFNLNEVPFSCRDILFACIDQDNPRLEETLEEEGVSVASFEYGINNALPSSKGAELLCPSNNISDGIVSLTQLDKDGGGLTIVYVGLNNGNGRGSIDTVWGPNRYIPPPGPMP